MVTVENVKSSPFEVVFKAEQSETNESMEFSIFHSFHSKRRSSQRGLSNEKISMVLAYGFMVSKQGMDYYILRSRDIPEHLQHLKSELENTVVLLASDGCIITCYRGKKSIFKHIYKKSKTLF